VGEAGAASAAQASADRLAAAGVVDPPWKSDLGRPHPRSATLMEEPAFDDGVSVMVEFAGVAEVHTLSVYIDHNLGGLVKDILLAGPIDELRAGFAGAPDADRVRFRELDLGEARARITAALTQLDRTFDPPVEDDVHALRALVDARLRLLPAGEEASATVTEIPTEERDALLADFLDSDEGRRWREDEDAEAAAQLAIDFGADYNHGGPLRWSPVVVEIFMLDWLARKISEEPEFFARIPDVLTTWVQYAGRRRAVPAEFVQEAVLAVEQHRTEMLQVVRDPNAWGPAKVLSTAAAEAGVDLSDPAAMEQFLEEYNSRLR
jgi:hypothetical protein